MQRETYFGLSVLFSLLIFVVILPFEIQDLVILLPMILTLVLFYFLVQDRLERWDKKAHEEEKIRQQLIATPSRCSYCGEKNARRRIGRKWYCSAKCGIAHQRYRFLAIAAILALTGSLAPIADDPVFKVLLLGGVLISGVPAIYGIVNHYPNYIYRVSDPHHLKEAIPSQATKSAPSQRSSSETTYIKEIDLEVKNCCFQTARLQEKYCRCGLAIPPKLQDYIQEKQG